MNSNPDFQAAIELLKSKGWMVAEPQKIKVEVFSSRGYPTPEGMNIYSYTTSSKVPSDKFIHIREAIEKVLNEDKCDGSQYKRPPLGLMPQWLWLEKRVEQLEGGVKRYRDDFKEIPQEWIDEMHSLKNFIKTIRK